MMLRLFAFPMMLISAVAVAQVPAPDTPSGKVFSQWLSSFNSADPRQIAAFDKMVRQTRLPLASTLTLRERTGGFTLLRVEKSEPYALEALLKENDYESAARLSMSISREDPTVLLTSELKPAVTPAEFRPARLNQADAIASLEARAGQLASKDKFSGQLLVARDGKILLDKSWGLADRETGKPASHDTQFSIGSMSKMFTTVAIFQLIEAGKISLSDPLIKFLPTYPNKEPGAKVTIRHLLTYTGGSGDFFGGGFDSYRLQLRNHDAYIRQLGARQLPADPGAGFQYSHYGFLLLGAIIEKVSGLSYHAYVEQKIYRPAGMLHTGSLPDGSAVDGGYSTTHDLLLFAQALQAGKLISAASLAAATEPLGAGFGAGLGFMHDGEGPSRMFGHNDSAPGMSDALWIYPKAGYVVIGLSNMDPEATTAPMNFFTRRMPLR